MTTKDTANSTNSTPDLEQLFARARQSEPRLVDTNFTKLVIAHLPEDVPVIKQKRRLLQDMVGLALGLAAASLVVNPSELAGKLLAMVPQSITISPESVLLTACSISVMSLFAWWALERDG